MTRRQRCAVCGERLTPPRQQVVCSLACRVARKKLTRDHAREYGRRDYAAEYARRTEHLRAHWQGKAARRDEMTSTNGAR